MRHRVVVIGVGFAGLQVVLGLKGAECDITLIDQRNHHLFQPLLYQVATTFLATSDIAWPIRALMRERKDETKLPASADDIDREAREVILRNGERVPDDTLVVATSARHAYFGKDQWEADAPGLKTLEDATTIRRRLLLAFERDEPARHDEERQALLTFAVIGAGPTGVELVGIIAELAHSILPAEFRRVDTRKARVLLIEAGPRILPAFSEKLSGYARRALERRGVEVMSSRASTRRRASSHVLPDGTGRSAIATWAIWRPSSATRR